MTSNMGAEVFAELPPHLCGSEPQVQDSVMNIVRNTLSPELLNRIDETVVFNRLQREHMDQIAEMGIQDIANRLESGQNMILDVSQLAVSVLADKGYDLRYGARPLKRTLARDILNPLSRLVLEGSVQDGEVVSVRTLAEAMAINNNNNDNNDNNDNNHSPWISSAGPNPSKNDVVLLRNRDPTNYDQQDDDEEEDDEIGLLEGRQGSF
eukprot:CAMPEP_0118704488 /NCGR_PEP_ID=MMETSP0800-20121206/19267_1 /TAXON_ID=210618 ORGANISM="Striatella unipunctata, Strain CCMP2910" /NCGR_SAMPLE_ID=MMETSP0800 /ASSEMBLY_ACC=CAM_ASM_000638 /LENGTH=208 /DNA_ID=CAMNT_0006606391 /DNA_START=501 /DNA_END=1127 /DNA_ORIENTATION=+